MKKKKGFTLVELLVVIAILAVLATVSVVGYMGFTKKAQVSNDTSLVSQLNTLLKADEAVDGKAKTPTDALKVTEESGYDVTKLTPTTDKYNIVWNQEENQFALLDESDNAVYGTISSNNYMNWKFVDTYTEASSFSTYLKGEVTIETITTSNGLDVGNNTVSTINYVNSEKKDNVIIRTNGGTLNVNAENDTVYHYGISDRANITSVADESYHVFGDIKFINVNDGHVVLENNSLVKAIAIDPSTNANVTIDLNDSNTTLYKTSNSNDTNTHVNSNTTIVINEIGSKEIDNVASGVKDFEGGAGTEANPYLIATGEQALKMENSKGYFKIIDDIIVNNEIYLSGKTFNIDLNGHTIELYYSDDAKPNNGSVIYIGGSNSKLTIKDSSEKQTGKILGETRNYPNKVTSAIRIGNYGKLDIYGGTFFGRSEGTSCIYTYGKNATVNIYGGIFKCDSPYNGTYYVLNHEDGKAGASYNNKTGGSKMIVHGGTFINYNPGVTVVDPENTGTGKISLADGCVTTQEIKGKDTYYTVSK